MYGIPPGSDFSYLIGATLREVTAGDGQVVLALSGDTDVTIAAGIVVRYRDGTEVRYDRARAAAAVLGDLTGETVVVAEGDAGAGALRLMWSSGVEVLLIDSWSDIESFTIRCGEFLLLV